MLSDWNEDTLWICVIEWDLFHQRLVLKEEHSYCRIGDFCLFLALMAGCNHKIRNSCEEQWQHAATFVWNFISKRVCVQHKEKRKIQFSTSSASVPHLIYKLFGKHGCAIAKNTLKQKDCGCFLSLWGLNSWDPLSGTSRIPWTTPCLPLGSSRCNSRGYFSP